MLGVRNYERIVLLLFILRHVFIDAKWVAEEYLKRCKAGAWKKENKVESLKCFSLECIINAVDGGTELPQDIDIDCLIYTLFARTFAHSLFWRANCHLANNYDSVLSLLTVTGQLTLTADFVP
jgi:hypothetical protein